MEFKPEKFGKVLLNTSVASECSPPEQLPTWRGIIINAPETIKGRVGDSGISIPICGYYQLAMDALEASGPMRFVVKHKDSDSIYRGAMIEEDASPDVPSPNEKALSPEQMKRMASGSYFNPDLLRYVKMPTAPGSYDVYAEYAGAKSNTVSFMIEL
jgi:hypothetical protein